MITRTLLPRLAIVLSVAACALAADYVARPARADTKAVSKKPPPPPDDPKKRAVISDCTRAAYAALDKERAALTALHGGDKVAFDIAYALRKKEIVGAGALRAKGCAVARVE